MSTQSARPMLVFGLRGERFAIAADLVQEILDPVPVTDVPGAKTFASGLINVRGRIVPLTDPGIRLGMPPATVTIDTRFIVIGVELRGEPVLVGIRADKVHEVIEIDQDEVENTPDIGMKWRPDFIDGIGKRGTEFIIIPNIVRILSAD